MTRMASGTTGITETEKELCTLWEEKNSMNNGQGNIVTTVQGISYH